MSALWIFTFLVSFQSFAARSIEPQCSPYDFFERTIEKVVRVEQSNELLRKDLELEIAEFKKFRDTSLLALEEFKSKAEASLETQNKHIEESNTAIEEKLETLKGLEEKMTEGIRESLEKVKSNVEMTLEKQNKQIAEYCYDLKTPTIVFTAKDATVSHLSKEDTIVFPTVVKNEGSGYDRSTGEFTAPVTGTYLFSVQVCLDVNKVLRLRVVAADTVIAASTYGQDYYAAVCHNSDGVAVLSKGDKVMVTIAVKDSGNVIYKDVNTNNFWTSFSGVLIHK